MSKLLLVSLLIISVAFACHPSCNCVTGHVCDSCVFEGSVIDVNKRSCPCPLNYFTKSIYPFVCERFQQINADGEDISTTMGACELVLKTNINFIQFDCDSQIVTSAVTKENKVTNTLIPKFDHVSIDPSCQLNLETTIWYKDPFNPVETYIPLSSSYYTIVGQEIRIVIPLNDLDLVFGPGPLSASDQFTNVIHFMLKIGVNGDVQRTHKWDLTVYTNRDQVKTFTLDVTPQETEGCQDNQECIVIADLDTVQTVCSDDSCTSVRANNIYVIDDIFIAKICFADPSYTKNLKFVSLYFKNDLGQVFDFSEITVAVQTNYCLIVKLTLIEPSNAASIQVNMLIDDTSRFRRLADSSSPASAKSSFSAKITAAAVTTTTTNSNSSNFLMALSSSLAFAMLL